MVKHLGGPARNSKRRQVAAICSMGLTLLIAENANAAPTDPVYLVNEASRNGVFSFDYGVPTSPALTLAGLSSDKGPTSTSLKPFVFSAPTAAGGNAGTAYAVDIAPAWLIVPGGDQHLLDYVTGGQLNRIFYRTRFGVAAYEGSDGGGDAKKAKASKLAIGLSVSLLDDSDPLVASDGSDPISYKGTSISAYWLKCLKQAGDKFDYGFTPANEEMLRRLNEIDALGGRLSNSDLAAPLTDGDIRKSLIDINKAKVFLKEVADTNYQPTNVEVATVRADLAKANDERHSYGTKLSDAVSDAKKQVQPILDAVYKAKAAVPIQLCAKQSSFLAQSSPDFDFGAGVVWSGDAGKLEHFVDPAAAIWLAYRNPFGVAVNQDMVELTSYWAIGGSAHAIFNATVNTGVTATPQIKANTYDTWLALERYSQTTHFALEGGYSAIEPINPAQSTFAKSGFRWLATASMQVASENDGVWLGLSYGTAQGNVSTLNDRQFLVTLNFGPPKVSSVFGIGN